MANTGLVLDSFTIVNKNCTCQDATCDPLQFDDNEVYLLSGVHTSVLLGAQKSTKEANYVCYFDVTTSQVVIASFSITYNVSAPPSTPPPTVTTNCTIDQSAIAGQCIPVICPLKYVGARDYYDTASGLCQANENPDAPSSPTSTPPGTNNGGYPEDPGMNCGYGTFDPETSSCLCLSGYETDMNQPKDDFIFCGKAQHGLEAPTKEGGTDVDGSANNKQWVLPLIVAMCCLALIIVVFIIICVKCSLWKKWKKYRRNKEKKKRAKEITLRDSPHTGGTPLKSKTYESRYGEIEMEDVSRQLFK